MYAHLLLFEKKITIQKGPLFTIFKRFSSIHKNNPPLVASIVLKKIYFHVFVRFLKNTFNFTRSCAFAQKAKFYALKMLKNKISRILKLPSWQHCIEEISTQYCYLNVVNMPAQKDNSVKLIVHKSLLTHGKQNKSKYVCIHDK